MFGKKNSWAKKYDDQINNLNNQKLEYQKEIKKINSEVDNLQNNRRDAGLAHYGDKKKREELIEKGRASGYSETKLGMLQSYIEEWNQDNVTNEILDDFTILEQFVAECYSYQNNTLYRISNFFSAGGGNI